MKKIFLLLSLLFLVSCSMNDTDSGSDDFDDWGDDSDEVGRSISSTPEQEKDIENAENFLKDDENQELFEDDKGDGVFVYNEEVESPNSNSHDFHPKVKKPVMKSKAKYTGSYAKHVVKRGETLMWIAFRIYGDYSKWKELRRLNSHKISNYSHIKPGTVLSYRPAINPYSRPSGSPYLIKLGDTLGKVSDKVYGTQRNWKKIWRHNPRQIKNPNLIFAGFTLFYQKNKL